MNIVIIGGVAGGASFAARMRRLNETANITVIERGRYVSFANCGLPYHISETIPNREDLILKTPEDFKLNYNVDVRVEHEALSINRKNKTVAIKNLNNNEIYTMSYDKLVLSPGAKPFVPPTNGVEAKDFFVLRDVPDLDKIKKAIKDKNARRALVLGGGFIGIEVVENLIEAHIETHLVELAPQVMIPFDIEMANILHKEIKKYGVNLYLSTKVADVLKKENYYHVTLSTGVSFDVDLMICATGVKPEGDLAKAAGLKVTERNAIMVNKSMQTSDPDIYGLGDALVIEHAVLKKEVPIPLAGPANKQARIAANNIAGIKDEYKGSVATAIAKVFSLAAASTGLNERQLKENKFNYSSLYIHPFSHAGYYPGAKQMTIKALFEPIDGVLYGAQIIGADGADKRIDVFATAIQAGMSVYALKDLDLAYAPPFGSAKDPINMLGFVAHNQQEGLVSFVSPIDTSVLESSTIVDVRTPEEYSMGRVPKAINIPLYELRQNLTKISKEKSVVVYCTVGIRSYNAFRILKQNGFKNVYNLSGGFKNYQNFTYDPNKDKSIVKANQNNTFAAKHEYEAKTDSTANVSKELHLEGVQCPGPIMAIKKALDSISNGEVIKAYVSDAGFAKDIEGFCKSTGNTLIETKIEKDKIVVCVAKGGACMSSLNNITNKENKKTIVVFSDSLDRAMATFIIANGARAMGSEVTLFFTFWGLNLLKKEKSGRVSKNLLEKMMGQMMPKGPKAVKLSKMNMLGLGTKMMKYVMGSKNVDSLTSLITKAHDSGIKLVACSMTMEIMGIKKEELLDGVEIGGVASYLSEAERANLNLFI